MSGCYQCGSPDGNEARLCPECNEKRRAHQDEIIRKASSRSSSDSDDEPFIVGGEAAGFWLRFIAFLVDSSIIAFVQTLFLWVSSRVFGLALQQRLAGVVNSLAPSTKPNLFTLLFVSIVAMLSGVVVSLIVSIWYRPFFESSPKQATPGKLIMKLGVCRVSGEPISLGQALGREACRSLWLVPLAIIPATWLITGAVPNVMLIAASLGISILIGAGQYAMIGFTSEGAGLHDLLTDTRVVARGEIRAGELPIKVGFAVIVIVLFTLLTYLVRQDKPALQSVNITTNTLSPVDQSKVTPSMGG